MYNRNIFTLVYITFTLFFTSIYGEILTKDEVLKLKNSYNNYYCKDDICVSTYDYESEVDIPDINGNSINYIYGTCNVTAINSNTCYKKQCNNDLECLSNKCMNNFCVFNEASPVVHCDYQYHFNTFKEPTTDMYCGKANGDTCNDNDECSSMNCDQQYHFCSENLSHPSESRIMAEGFFNYILIIILIIAGIIGLCIIGCITVYCCCYK